MKKFITTSTLLACTAIIGSAQAATVSYLGLDTTTGADWRTASTAKSATFDVDGDNIYGTDGYFMGFTALGAANSNIETGRTKSDVPSYISSLASGGAFFVSDNYVNFDDPTGPGEGNGALYYNTGTKFTFTVDQATEFVLTVLIGQNAGGGAPTSITINQTTGGSATATTGTLSGTSSEADYAFFSIDAAAGDVFDVDIVASNSTGITGVAFDTVVIPEPATGAMALIGLGVMASRRRRG